MQCRKVTELATLEMMICISYRVSIVVKHKILVDVRFMCRMGAMVAMVGGMCVMAVVPMLCCHTHCLIIKIVSSQWLKKDVKQRYPTI